MASPERSYPEAETAGLPARAWASEADQVLQALAVDPAAGLTAAEARRRLAKYGANRLGAVRPRQWLAILIEQLRGLVVLLLVGAAAVAFAFRDVVEGAAILAVVVINASLGFFTELRAVRSMEALRQLGRTNATVRRGGQLCELPAANLVPGDIVVLAGGDIVSADLRLIEAAKLAVDESALTGESLPVRKATTAVPAGAHLGERANILFKGTSVARGTATGVVVATGLATELGHISSLVAQAEPEHTPLEKKLDRLGRRLVIATLVVAALTGVAAIAGGKSMMLSIEVAVALAVAAIPEGLPIVATIALARGMWRMARREALISRLSAVETLGATTVILTDKTGTLTENRMTVTQLCVADVEVGVSGTGLELEGAFRVGDEPPPAAIEPLMDQALTVAALCNNAALVEGENGITPVGDPTEVALLVAARKRGLDAHALQRQHIELREEPFDPATKSMATFNRYADYVRVAVKGAPEAVLAVCATELSAAGPRALGAAERRLWEQRSDALAAQGLRTLMLAEKHVATAAEAPFEALTLLGLVGMTDPPRAGVREAIASCARAGIRTIMVTGDHPATARSIGASVGLTAADDAGLDCVDGQSLGDADAVAAADELLRAQLFARTTPEQKLGLIQLFQNHGHVVAMTGDGVNDAPALKKADIGIAMGIRGTQVAKDAAAMVLQDDDFATIVEAVRHGRAIFANIRKFVVYLMSCNLGEVLIVALATMFGAPLPLLPLQILFLNLVTDVFPALALGVGRGSEGQMDEPPRASDEAILTRYHWLLVVGYGLLMSVVVLAAMSMAQRLLGFDERGAVTVSFLTLALAQLWHVFNMRADRRAWLRNEITSNRWVWGALLLCVGLVLLAIYLPGLNSVMQLVDPGPRGWALAAGFSLLPLLLGPWIEVGARRFSRAT